MGCWGRPLVFKIEMTTERREDSNVSCAGLLLPWALKFSGLGLDFLNA